MSSEVTTHSEQKKDLTRKLGFWPALALAIGTTIGSGIFINSTTVAQAAGGVKVAILAWIIGGLINIPQMMVLSELGTAYPMNGGGYVYFKEAGMKPLAFLFGWTCFLGLDPPGIALVAISTVTYLAVFIPILGGLAGKFIAALLIIGLAAIHYRSVKGGGAFEVVITVAKVLPFIIIIGAGLFFIKGGNLASVSTGAKIPMFAGLAAGISATTWAYSGMYGLLDMSGEFKEPGKVLPRAMIGAAVIITAIYTLVAVVVFGLMPFGNVIKTSTPITDALKFMPGLGGVATVVVGILAIIVMLGGLNSLIMFQPRLEYAMAKDDLFFKRFGHVNQKYETPDFSIIIQVVLAVFFVFATNIVTLLGYITFLQLLENALLFSSLLFCRKKPGYNPAYKCPAGVLMTLLSIALCLWMAWNAVIWAPGPSILCGAVIIITGLPCYFYWDSQKKKKALAAGENKE